MKVLMINGSPHENGTTKRALDEIAKVLESENIQTEIVTIGNKDVTGCRACGACAKLGNA